MSHAFINGFVRSVRKTVDASMYWGDGRDGILTAGTTLYADSDFKQYEDFAVLQYERIHWDPAEPEILTVDKPCRGLVLFVQGDVYIGPNATISMKKKGSILPCNPEELLDTYGASKKMRRIVDTLNALRGGAGGDGGHGATHGHPYSVGGIGGIGRICQGGRGAGPGGVSYSTKGGDGGNVIYPEGWPQNGGNGDNSTFQAQDGFNGGAGGISIRASDLVITSAGRSFGAGPGGGCIGSTGVRGGDGEHTGGFILIIAKENVVIEGTVDVTGGSGGEGLGTQSYSAGGGGGAGGGVIAFFSQKAINVSSATINKSGGAGGTASGVNGSTPGTNGLEGTLYTEVL